jgi:alpha/beta superfamily hydrolase
MKTKEQLFSAHPNKPDVSSVLEVPVRATALLVLAHGAGAGMYHRNMQRIAEVMHGNRIATLRYQFPFGERGGGRDSLEVSLSTVERAVELAKMLEPRLPLFAGGHSFGGRMTSIAASENRLFQPVYKQIRQSATIQTLDAVDHGYRVSKRSRKTNEDVFDEMGRLTRQWLDQL